MNRQVKKLVLNGAPSQYDRWRPALDPRYAQPDDRSFPQLLNFATHYGSLINFYNLQNLTEGDWAPFFLSDTSMILAAILALDSQEIERTFESVKSATLGARFFEKKFELLRGLYEVIVGVARQINDWLAGLGLNMASETAQLLQYQLVSLIESNLGRQLRLLKSYSEGAALPEALRQPLAVNYQGFLPIWGLDRVYPDGLIYKGPTRNRKIDAAVPQLEPIFWMFMDAVSQLKQFARAQFPGTMKENDHKPFLALYMAFVKLFETAQVTLNSMSERYSHFYYREMLRGENKAAIPDQVYLTFALDSATGASSATVPARTLFPAGMDGEGAEILYGSEQAAFVTAATIASLRNVRVISGPLLPEAESPNSAMAAEEIPPPEQVPPQEIAGAEVVQRILVSEISVEAMQEQVTPATWPTFGSAEAGQSGVVETVPAQVGFAIASDYLMLTGGRRTVWLIFDYSSDCLTEIAAATGLAPLAILYIALNGGDAPDGYRKPLELFLSTADGWLPILSYYGSAVASDFSIVFNLPASVAPVVPISPEAPPPEAGTVNATNPAPGLPTLKVYLRQDEPILLKGPKGSFRVYPLSVFSALRISNIRIVTRTEGLEDLNLRNTNGSVNVATPFPVFGAMAVPGTFLQLSNPELFLKVPTDGSLYLTIRWYNLPANQTGFAGYYQDYKVGLDGVVTPDLFNNQTFRGKIEVVNPGLWLVEQAEVFLFRTPGQRDTLQSLNFCNYPIPEVADALCGHTTFFNLRVRPRGDGVPNYYQPETSALRLSLTVPPYGFGSDLYTKNVLHATLKYLPDGPSENATIEYPNPPWMPMAESVSLTYDAECRFSPGASADACGQFFYLLPFDGYEPAPASAQSPLPLLPQFPFAGSLYLGFANLTQPQTISLLFQMAAGSAQDLPSPQWQYLSGNVWHDLDAAQIRSDTTNALKNSGVLTLSLPQLNAAETVLPGGDQWLRATVPGEVERFAEIGGIYPHVLLASWQDNGGAGENLRHPLPPFTITSSVQPLADIAEIIQPMASFAGHARENDREFKVSLGERLRHKDRALLAWDYEALVLDRFPTIWKAQALPARNVDGGHAPGDVLVVVVAGEESLEIADPAIPSATALMLQQIQDYLQQRISPFVSLQVVNPVYVRITVVATVAFQTGEAAGARIGQLNSELVEYLSPWFYDAARAAKGGDYATPDAISEFIQNRPYVAALNQFTLQYDPDPQKLDWYFLTSASVHHITETNTLEAIS